MFVQVKNENYGYAVSTYGDYVVVANPDLLRWSSLSASVPHTGTIDVFRHNKSKDEHDFLGTLHQSWRDFPIELLTEDNNIISASSPISTESSSLASYYSEYNINVDTNFYTSSLENGYGTSLDMFEKFLIVGSPYMTELIQTSASFITSSWAVAQIYDFARIEWTANSSSAAIYTIDDPDLGTAAGQIGSFGKSVSINRDWVAVGSPYWSGSHGVVHIYKNNTVGNNYSWSYFQSLHITSSVSQPQFGFSLKLNKAESPYSCSLVVGCGNPIVSKAYYFEYVGNQWTQSYIFEPDLTIKPMTFNSEYFPQDENIIMNTANGFGFSVGCYDDAVIIGEPYDRSFYEFSGSSLYQQGSMYIFEHCPNFPRKFKQVFKSYGNNNILLNNLMGWSVDMFDNNAVIGVPKLDMESITSCDIAGTLNQLHNCNGDLQSLLCGQNMLVQKNTGSGDWAITNVYQRKKKFLSPYRDFGYNVSIADQSIVVGSPMLLADSNREINILTTQSANTNLDDLTGKSYIYNLHNLQNQFYVGNVFYRNGKIIIMTSGSAFDGLFYNPVNTYTYEYDLEFKSQHTIYEKQVICSVNPGEFNVSTNPTSIVTPISIMDINGNGTFDFQDVDVILSYMQYKNTSILGVPISTNWSSSIIQSDDEISLLNYYHSNIDSSTTPTLISQSIVKWETVNTEMQNILDLNNDSKIDVRDMNILWKYFSNRLTQEKYATYITPACHRRLLSDVLDYLNGLTHKLSKPNIKSDFLDYERLSTYDKTGSYLAPMVSTIGLYKGLDLVAVAKLGTPIKITPELPINFVVKIDF